MEHAVALDKPSGRFLGVAVAPPEPPISSACTHSGTALTDPQRTHAPYLETTTARLSKLFGPHSTCKASR